MIREGVDVIELASEQGPTESIEELVSRRNIGRLVEQAMATLSEDQRATLQKRIRAFLRDIAKLTESA